MNNQEYQQSIERYSVAMLFAKKMLESSIISNEDYDKIEDKIAQKNANFTRRRNKVNVP